MIAIASNGRKKPTRDHRKKDSDGDDNNQGSDTYPERLFFSKQSGLDCPAAAAKWSAYGFRVKPTAGIKVIVKYINANVRYN